MFYGGRPRFDFLRAAITGVPTMTSPENDLCIAPHSARHEQFGSTVSEGPALSGRSQGELQPLMNQQNNELKALGRNIRQARYRLHISQEELSQRSGLHRTYVCDVELGNRNITFYSLVAMARGLGLTVSDLTRNVEAPNGT